MSVTSSLLEYSVIYLGTKLIGSSDSEREVKGQNNKANYTLNN